jgi:WD40 repeat protein
MNSVDRATESRRRVSGDVFAYQFYGGGTISPDGQTAALFGGTGNDENTLHLLDLRTGRDLDTKTAVGQDGVYDGGGAVWSPDSRWVFTQSSNGKVVAVERSSATAHQLTLPGVPVTQVALRVDQPTS